MYSPRSRNWVAHQDGTDSWSGEGSAGTPVKEYCYHCLNHKKANEICGTGNSGNYDEWLDINGDPIPWNSQATYIEGEIITVKSYLSTNHGGHEDLFVCPDGSSSTQECLEANPLEYIDSNHGAPRDVKYPGRGYYSNEVEFEMRYKLPMGVTGDKVMLQWRYVTGNSCMSPGYCCHDDDDYFDLYQNVSSWKRANAALCTYPLDPTGATGTGKPELFWNCAEITILPSNGQPTTPPVPSPTLAPVANPISPPVAAPTPSGVGCCSRDFKNCNQQLEGWCSESKENCEGSCMKWWLPNGAVGGDCIARYEGCSSAGSCCGPLICKQGQCTLDSPNYPTKTTAPAPTPSPVAPTNAPVSQPALLCSTGSGKSTWEALQAMESITHEVSQTPYILSAVASGGAAGDGSYVVSESQAYGVLTAGFTILSMEENDTNYNEAKRKFEGYFNGWRQMCRNSAPAPCQNPSYCDGGSSPCLPGWKHLADFSEVEGTGAAPDGDEDAIVGMIIALKAVESDSMRPSWYDEVRDWADRSCTQFLQDNTVVSSSGLHRLVKLGSCWGGWGSDGNNPSYHAPGHYRMMRDFQASIDSRSYTLPSYVNSETWNMVIDTSYKFLETTQCPETGLVPNWALVREVNSQTLAKQSGSFSGSGTPQYEFGAEASRTLWRVAFDAAAYPEESASQSGAFLDPLYKKLVENFDANPGNGWEYFGDDSLEACSPIVSNVFNSWQWNYFISAPVFSTLVGKIKSEYFTGKSFDQQTMINAACGRVSDTANQGYYPLSWQVIAQMTLNGEVAKAGALFQGPPQVNPTKSPTLSPVQPITPEPSKAPTIPEGCYSINYKDCLPDVASGDEFCNKIWLPTGAKNNCASLGSQCASNQASCCEPAECFAESGYAICVPPSDSTSTPTKAPASQSPSLSAFPPSDSTSIPTKAPVSQSPTLPACIVCDDEPTSGMKKKGKSCTDINLKKKCNKNASWIKKGYCQLSCYNEGLGYVGDVCCTDR